MGIRPEDPRHEGVKDDERVATLTVFLGAWLTELAETDGRRTYPVSRLFNEHPDHDPAFLARISTEAYDLARAVNDAPVPSDIRHGGVR